MKQNATAFAVFSVLIVCALATTPPKWASTYIASGILNIPYVEITEPFKGWYDKPSGKSRIDYYGGMVKTYHLSNEGAFGTVKEVVPTTNSEEEIGLICRQVYGTHQSVIVPQSVLPDCNDFVFAGTETLHGHQCDKFVFQEVINTKLNSYTVFVRYEISPKNPDSRQPIPVRYEMRGTKSPFGYHSEHFYIDYDTYSHEDIPAKVFDVECKCITNSDTGANHFVIFNPMFEFMHPHHSIVADHYDNEFGRFVGKHRKQYDTVKERTSRQSIFKDNLRFIHSQNRARRGFSLAVNHLADRTAEEMRVLRGYRNTGGYNGGKEFQMNDDDVAELPDSYDWRIFGAVTQVKDQLWCGSCWAFGAVGAMEGAYFLKNGGNLVRLSEQALMDCSWSFNNSGCDGGFETTSYEWIEKMGGIPEEEAYGGYLALEGYCHAGNVTLVAPITGYVNVMTNNLNALRVALFKHGPISVGIDASHPSFHFYSHGIYYEPTCSDHYLDHAVLAVGYGEINGEAYWLVKNSWSNLWGNDGYILMSARDNNCGVMTAPTYVTM